MPKTAGVSFLGSLEERFGPGHIFMDYADRPGNTAAIRRNSLALLRCILNSARALPGIECIHGHFLPLKYHLLGARTGARFVTWLRDPVERMASGYYYWKRSFRPGKSSALHRRLVEENWSLERFCLGPELKNCCSRFFWGFPLTRFDFIGIVEYYESELDYFSRTFLDAPLDVLRRNVNPNKNQNRYIEDLSLRQRIESHHSKDMALYQMALALRRSRLDRLQKPLPQRGQFSPQQS